MNGDDKNKHDLSNAGNVLGSMYNTNRYNENYSEKKGMKFFVIMIVILTAFSIFYLLVRPMPSVNLIHAGEESADYYKLGWSVFRGYFIKEEASFDYQYFDDSYQGLSGRDAQLAIIIDIKEADVVVGLPGYLEKLAARNKFRNTVQFFHEAQTAIITLLKHDVFESDYDLYYGVPASTNFKTIDFDELEFIAFVSKSIEMHNKYKEKLIEDLTTVYE